MRTAHRHAMAAVAALPLTVSGLMALPAATASEPVAPIVQAIKLSADVLQTVEPDANGLTDGPDATASPRLTPGDSEPVLATGVIETEGFELAALTWDGDADATDLEFSVRARSSDGTWTSWFDLHDDGHGPDADTAEAAHTRRGTEPLITPGADAVEVRIRTGSAGLPGDLQIDLVDPGAVEADATVEATAAAEAATSLRPLIFTRAQWGADESIREPGDPLYGDIRGAFVHHTAGTNSYDRDDVPGIIRSIYAYHVNGRGWRDIGYNFLVDRFGRTWEGRYGGMNEPVVGAHVSGYNSFSVGASVLGTYTSKTVEPAVIDALGGLFAWKFTMHGIDPTGSIQYPGESKLKTISGHRDGGDTECPGDQLYARLGSIRTKVTDRIEASPPLVGIGDFNTGGDGPPDMIARRHDGTLWLHSGGEDGTPQPRTQIGSSTAWGQYTALVGVGDVNSGGGGRPDMIARHDDGTLWLYPGRGDGTFYTRRQIGTSTAWGQYTALVGVGDLTRDGPPDLIPRQNDGTLWLYPGHGDGTFGPRRRIGSSTAWGQYTALIGVGDATSDGPPDLIARRYDGTLWLYPGSGESTFDTRTEIGSSTDWGQYQ